MKRNYLIIAGLLVALIIVIVVVMVAISGDDEDETTTEQPTDAVTVETLEEMQLNPPDDYINQLQNIILDDSDPYVRERGIFTLTDIALRDGDTKQVIDFLKEIANNEADDDVRSAAYANVDLIRKNIPLPATGNLELSISGQISKGSTISIIAVVTCDTEVSDAVVGIEKLHHDIEPLSFPVINIDIQPNEPVTVEYELKLNETGDYSIPVSLLLSFDRIDSEKIQHEILLTVNETYGEYSIIDDG